MIFRMSRLGDGNMFSRYYQNNAAHLKPWEPIREPGYHNLASWENRLAAYEDDQRKGAGFYFYSFCPDSSRIIAVCSLTNIIYGAFKAGFLSFSVLKDFQGQGHMKKLCLFVIDHAFNQLSLNRIMANYMPGNEKSAGLLKSLGFVKEGLAKNYLCINGNWEDHILTSLLAKASPSG